MKYLAWILLIATAFAQNPSFVLPDTPSVTPEPVAKCGRWKCWDFKNVPTREVIKSKALWATTFGDFGISSSDSEFSHQGNTRIHGGNPNHPCVEAGEGLPLHPSRGQLYAHNWKENVTTFGVSFLWLKVGGPKWVMPFFLTGPAIVHGREDYRWVKNCW